MEKYLFSVIFILTAYASTYAKENYTQKSLGIGFLQIDIQNSKLPVYTNFSDKDLVDEIHIEKSNDGSWMFKSKIDLKPADIFAGSTNEGGGKKMKEEGWFLFFQN